MGRQQDGRPWQEAVLDEAVSIIVDGGSWGRGNGMNHGKLGAAVIWADKEIAKLRARVIALEQRGAPQPGRGSLKPDEREAIELSLLLEWPLTAEQWHALARCLGPMCQVPANKHKVAIRAFLARQPGPEVKEVGDG
jgi:hypothetical protein